MKATAYTFVLLLFCFSSCKTIKPASGEKPEVVVKEEPVSEAAKTTIKYSDQTTWLLGYFNRSQFTREPHSEWFLRGYDDYKYNGEVVKKLSAISKDGITIKIILGTWCPDSRREVPHFMRIIDIWEFPAQQVTLIGVDNEKQSPVGEYAGLGIERVPTFIIYRNNIEAGRIIENPLTSLEQDMVNILTRNE
jgi:thiol-disulfide isomerase/thioredoxin